MLEMRIWPILYIISDLNGVYIFVEVSFSYFNYLASVAAGRPESPRGHM